jgi:hypothetical protein
MTARMPAREFAISIAWLEQNFPDLIKKIGPHWHHACSTPHLPYCFLRFANW